MNMTKAWNPLRLTVIDHNWRCIWKIMNGEFCVAFYPYTIRIWEFYSLSWNGRSKIFQSIFGVKVLLLHLRVRNWFEEGTLACLLADVVRTPTYHDCANLIMVLWSCENKKGKEKSDAGSFIRKNGLLFWFRC